MIEFAIGAYHFIVGILIIALLLAGVLVALSILALLARRLGKNREQVACKKDLFQVHKTTVFDRTGAIKQRLADHKKCSSGSAARRAAAAAATTAEKPVAVLRFDGDVMATTRKHFARFVDEILVNKDSFSEAIVVVSSPGGGVAQYGQLYAEMERIRKSGLPLTVCVDTYAASGGYLMSVPANRIVAAPFAMVGSIGVVSELINANKFLKDHGFEPLVLTAGKFKRTVTTTGEVTEEAKQHYKEQLEAIHRAFINAVTKYRKVDVDKACTGDHWTAAESVELGLNLVDELATSQDYLLKVNQDRDLVFLGEKKNPLESGIFRFLVRLSDHVIERIAWRFGGSINA